MAKFHLNQMVICDRAPYNQRTTVAAAAPTPRTLTASRGAVLTTLALHISAAKEQSNTPAWEEGAELV